VTPPEHLSIDTPEQIVLDFPLAGVGSRFLALAFDTLLQVVAFVVVGIVAAVAGGVVAALVGRSARSANPWIFAGVILAWFAVYAGYFAAFEALWRGQTPGKRLVGLRVIDVSGRPVSVYAAILRNLVRIVDQFPGIYAVGIVSVMVTSRHQRLGDLAAGTVVVREQTETLSLPVTTVPVGARIGAHHLTADDIVVLERFLHRRSELDAVVRLETARRIAQRMAAKLQIDSTEDEERLIERLAAEYRSTQRAR
jgi:uncharacterized RDD family membrane protein YckC